MVVLLLQSLLLLLLLRKLLHLLLVVLLLLCEKLLQLRSEPSLKASPLTTLTSTSSLRSPSSPSAGGAAKPGAEGRGRGARLPRHHGRRRRRRKNARRHRRRRRDRSAKLLQLRLLLLLALVDAGQLDGELLLHLLDLVQQERALVHAGLHRHNRLGPLLFAGGVLAQSRRAQLLQHAVPLCVPARLEVDHLGGHALQAVHARHNVVDLGAQRVQSVVHFVEGTLKALLEVLEGVREALPERRRRGVRLEGHLHRPAREQGEAALRQDDLQLRRLRGPRARREHPRRGSDIRRHRRRTRLGCARRHL